MNGRQRQAIALAFIRQGVHDIRPDLLLYVAERDDERFPKLFQYGCAYLAKRFQAAELEVPEDVIQIAVVDALAVIQTRKAPYSTRERAAELKLREHVYAAIRKSAIRLFEQRYQEGLSRFAAAMNNDETSHEKRRVRDTPDDRLDTPARTDDRVVG